MVPRGYLMVPGGYLNKGVLLSCSGQLKKREVRNALCIALCYIIVSLYAENPQVWALCSKHAGERRRKHEGWPSLKQGGSVSPGWPVAKSKTLAPGGLYATPGLSHGPSTPPAHQTRLSKFAWTSTHAFHLIIRVMSVYQPKPAILKLKYVSIIQHPISDPSIQAPLAFWMIRPNHVW